MTGPKVGRRMHPCAPSRSTVSRGVLRLDGVELAAGEYSVIARGLHPRGADPSATMRVEIRFATGRPATAEDPLVQGAMATIPVGESATLEVLHRQPVDGPRSFLLCFALEDGHGPVFLDAAPGGRHIELSVTERPSAL